MSDHIPPSTSRRGLDAPLFRPDPLTAGAVARMSPWERLHAANRLAADHLADTVQQAVAQPKQTVIRVLHGLGDMIAHPGDLMTQTSHVWHDDQTEGLIMSGRLVAGYVGIAGTAIGVGALLGRVGARATSLPIAARLLQNVGQRAFALGALAGTGALAVDVAALLIHESDAAHAATPKALREAAQRVGTDIGNLGMAAVTTGAAAAGGAGLKALGTGLRETELTNALSAARPKAAKGGTPTLTGELSHLVSEKIAYLPRGDRIRLAEYLNGKLSPAERYAVGRAMAGTMKDKPALPLLLATGEKAAWAASGIGANRWAALLKKGWTAEALGDVRQAIRESELPVGQQADILRRLSTHLADGDTMTAANGAQLRQAAVRTGMVESLHELGITRDLKGLSAKELDRLQAQVFSFDPRARTKLVTLLNSGKGTLDPNRFWSQAYKQLYADLGLDPAVYQALARGRVSMAGTTALERVYSQLRALPADSRIRVSKAIQAMALKPGTAGSVMAKANLAELTESIREALPESEQSGASSLATGLVKEMAGAQNAKTHTGWMQSASRLPGRLLAGERGAITDFAKDLGRSKLKQEMLLANTTAGIAKLPESVRRDLFSNLKPNQAISPQITNRLATILKRDFNVSVTRTRGVREIDAGIPIGDMDAASTVHLYNAMGQMAGPGHTLPNVLQRTRFARSVGGEEDGFVYQVDKRTHYTTLDDQALVNPTAGDAAGTPYPEAVWIHEAGHLLQPMGVSAAERRVLAEWAALGDWHHGQGGVADGINPHYTQGKTVAYLEPTVSGQSRQVATHYGMSDPLEDWAEFVRSSSVDPVATMQLAPHKFLYLGTRMAAGWAAPHLQDWAAAAGVDLQLARNVVAQRLGASHPVVGRIDGLLKR